MLARGFENWWNARLTRSGKVATWISVLLIVFVMSGVRVSMVVAVAIAAAIGLLLYPVFKRRGWTYDRRVVSPDENGRKN